MAGCITTREYPAIVRKLTTEDNLRTHSYAAFFPRSAYAYVGTDRIERYNPKRLGMPRPERNFSMKTNSTWGFQWTVGDQATAVQHGFFLHRSGYANRVNIIGVSAYDDRWPTDPYNGEPCLRQLERMAFEHPTTLVYQRALRFIKQQDQYGYSGAWETEEISFFSTQLLWYKNYYAKRKATQTGNVSKHSRAVIERAADVGSRAKHARKMRYMQAAKRAIEMTGDYE